MKTKPRLACSFLFSFSLAACGGSGSPGMGAGDAQTPPTTSAQAIQTWIAAGSYKAWHCEPTAHAPRAPSPHTSQNRVCSNDLLSATGPGEYPIGAASVKELVTDGQIAGQAVYVKDRTGGGESFVWFEANGSSVAAFGHGDSGTPKDVCVGCHANAGPSHFGHDFVFTQVK